MILAGLWGGSLFALRRLPSRVPMHWNLAGEVDRWGSPLEAVLVLPVIATAVYLLILAFDWGHLDFKAARAMAPRTTRQVRILVLLLLLGLHGTILWTTAQGGSLVASRLLVLMALFFVCLGNLMPRLEPNAWVGIRVPPTLEDREVWKRTHRLGGRVFVGGGLALLPLCLLPERIGNPVFLVLLITISVIPVVYAYWIRHQSESARTQPPEA